jgi:hypothetical protein
MPQIEYSEGFMMYLSKLFGTGQFTWQLNGPPYNVSFYTPLFYIVMGKVGGVFGYSILAGRIAVLACFLICLVFIYLIIRNSLKNKIYALIGALLPLTSYMVVGWSLFVRVDIPAIMFELIGVYVAIRWYKSHWFWLSIPLFLLAFWTKQAVFAGPVAVFIFILLKNWRVSMVYAGACLAGLAISLGIGQVLTDGQLIRHIILYTRTYPLIRPPMEYAAYLTVSYLPILPLIALSGYFIFKQFKSVISIFVIVAVVFNLILITRPGAAQNYFFEPIFALSIAAGCALPFIIQERKKVYLALFAVSIWALLSSGSLMIYPDTIYPEKFAHAEAVIQDATYPILTENAGLVLDAGKVPYYEPFVFNQLSRLEYWDRDLLISDLESKCIQYVITQFKLPFTGNIYYQEVQRFDDATQKAISENYHMILDASEARGYGFVVYKANE